MQKKGWEHTTLVDALTYTLDIGAIRLRIQSVLGKGSEEVVGLSPGLLASFDECSDDFLVSARSPFTLLVPLLRYRNAEVILEYFDYLQRSVRMEFGPARGDLLISS